MITTYFTPCVLIFGLFLTSTQLGCAMYGETTTADFSIQPAKATLKEESVISIFATRRSLAALEFERYLLSADTLFQECGQLRSKNTGRTTQETTSPLPTLTLGRYLVERKYLHAQVLTQQEQSAIHEALHTLLSTEAEIPPPPRLDSQGIFELLVHRDKNTGTLLVTSFDTIAESNDDHSRAVKELYALLRGLAKDGCGKARFFGVGAKTL